MKRCTACGLSKAITAFGKVKTESGKFRRRTHCNECRAEDRKKRTAAETPEQKRQRKDKFLRRTYGITMQQYDGMFTSENGCCASCNKHQNELHTALVVDHRHSDGKVRGLLCSGCNLALGNVKEDPDTLISLAGYIAAAAV